MKTRTRILWAIVAVAVVVGSMLVYDPVRRLVHVLNLFETPEIDVNFRTMDTQLASRTVPKSPAPWTFQRTARPLPINYSWQGKDLPVQAFIDKTNTTGLIVVRDDTILYENYFRGNTETSRAIAWSVSKSLLSALFGIAVGQGKITSLDDPVAQYVPELRDSGYGLVRLKDVLQMSSGITFNEDYGDFNSDINAMGRYFALDLPLANFVAGLKNGRKPGTFNHYVSMDTQVLGMVLTKATGRTLTALTEEQLWKPLGMEADAAWLIDGAGMEAAFGGFNAVLRDYARFGRLYLHQGNWNGVQVVPADWVKASVTPDAPHLMPGKRDSSSWVLGYGYQWWVPEGDQSDFLAIGIYGQAIYVSPATGIVIARTAAYQDYNKDGDDMELQSIEFFRSLAAQMK
ncbi:MAG: serine hydrolase [Spirochaetales bacterium]